MRIFLSVCFIGILLFSGTGVLSNPAETVQYPEPAPGIVPNIPTVRVHTNLVLVPVSVRNAADQPVSNLQEKDFAIAEDGIPVPLEHFGRPELSKLDIILVFDLTSSIWFYFDLVRESASGFVQSIFRPGDAVSVIGISSEPEVLLKRTKSLPAILAGLKNLRRFGAATAFFDALIMASRTYPERPDPETRRVMVVLSDGEDNLSRRTLNDALQQLQKTDVLFYSINPANTYDRLNRVSARGQKYMETIAEQTGGVAFLAKSYKDLAPIYSRIAEELQVQYLLGYNSPDDKMDGSYHSITVSIPNRPDLRVRARKGYYRRRSAPH